MKSFRLYGMGAAMTLALLVAPGCRSVSRVTLSQPQLSGRQRCLALSSVQTFWASDSQAERFLCELPLPGATTGRPMFLLYLRVTPPLVKAAKRSPEAYEVRGFLVQTHGEYAGRVDVSGGRILPTHLSRGRRHVRVELELEDASRIAGQLLAERDVQRLRIFETQRRPGDVQSILGSPP